MLPSGHPDKEGRYELKIPSENARHCRSGHPDWVRPAVLIPKRTDRGSVTKWRAPGIGAESWRGRACAVFEWGSSHQNTRRNMVAGESGPDKNGTSDITWPAPAAQCPTLGRREHHKLTAVSRRVRTIWRYMMDFQLRSGKEASQRRCSMRNGAARSDCSDWIPMDSPGHNMSGR